MMRLILFLVFISANIFSQNLSELDADFIKVDSIAIIGNNKTKSDIILRELNFKKGDEINSNELSFNRERIYSLGLFNKVRIYPFTKENQNIIYIEVEESWYFWPLPFVELKEHSLKKINYGINFFYKNFRGRNESISLNAAFGFDPGFNINYSNPWLIRKNNISFSAGFGYQTPGNRSIYSKYYYGKNFDYKIISSYLAIGKRINIFNDASIIFGYDFIKAPIYLKRITASKNNVDHSFKAGINYNYDSRNLKQFPDSGIFFNTNFYQKGFGIDEINYSILNFDFRNYFKLINQLTAKWRIATRFTIGNKNKIPFYDNSFLGGSEKIRGHFNVQYEGRNSYLGSLEMKYPLIKEWEFGIKLPVIPKNLTTYRIAIYANSFADAGAVKTENKKLSINDFHSGYGAGISLLFLPYNIVRFEYAFNEFGKGEFIFDLGFSF